jgi:hypothetical protein
VEATEKEKAAVQKRRHLRPGSGALYAIDHLTRDVAANA